MQPNYARIARNDDEPVQSSPWEDCDIAYFAIKKTHSDGAVLEAVAEWLCSDRGIMDTTKLAVKLSALGESAMDDYLKEIGKKPE